MPDLIRHPEVIEFTGFRLSPEWRQKQIPDFLRSHQVWYARKKSFLRAIANLGIQELRIIAIS